MGKCGAEDDKSLLTAQLAFYCTLHTAHYTTSILLHTRHCTVDTAQLVFYCSLTTSILLHTTHQALHAAQKILHTAHLAFSSHCPVPSRHCILHSSVFPLFAAHFKAEHTSHCTRINTNCSPVQSNMVQYRLQSASQNHRTLFQRPQVTLCHFCSAAHYALDT